MAPNECQFRAASGGLTDFVVAAAVLGFFAPAQCTSPAIIDGGTYYWRAEKDDLSEHELFKGTYSSVGPTITRTTVLQSSNGNGKVNFSAPPRVRLVLPTQQLVIQEDDGVEVLSSLSIVGGTATTSVAPALSITQTWNNAGVVFTGLSVSITETASASLSSALSVIQGNKKLLFGNYPFFDIAVLWLLANQAQSAINYAFQGDGLSLILNAGGASGGIEFWHQDFTNFASLYLEGGLPVFKVPSTGAIGFSSSTNSGAANADVKLYRDGAGLLALRNGTNYQHINIYNTYTNASNYERVTMGFFGDNVAYIATEAAGTGVGRKLSMGTNSATDVVLYNLSYAWTMSGSNGAWIPFIDGGQNLGGANNHINEAWAYYFETTPGPGFNSGFYWGVTGDAYAYGIISETHFQLDIMGRNAPYPAACTQPMDLLVYNTFTDYSNYEAGIFGWRGTSNVLTIGTVKGGSGVARNMEFVIGGTRKANYGITTGSRWDFEDSLHSAVDLLAGRDCSVTATGFFYWVGRSNLDSGADGNIRLTNAAVTDFGLLQFGGISASFPALKRSTTELYVRLADDSGWGDFQAGSGTFNVGVGFCSFGTPSGVAGETFVDSAGLFRTDIRHLPWSNGGLGFSSGGGGSNPGALAATLTGSGTFSNVSFRIFDTNDSVGTAAPANYEAGVFEFNSHVLNIGTQKGGTGVTRNMQLVVGGTVKADFGVTTANSWTFVSDGSGIVATPYFTARAPTTFGQGFFVNLSIDATNLSRIFLHLDASDVPRLGFNNTSSTTPNVEIRSGGAGILTLTDNAGSFGRLQFGGTTSSFPSLKRSSAELETRLADDSARAQHNAQLFAVTDGITAPAATAGLAKLFVDTADGDLKVIFGDGTTKTIVVDT